MVILEMLDQLLTRLHSFSAQTALRSYLVQVLGSEKIDETSQNIFEVTNTDTCSSLVAKACVGSWA